MTGIGAGGRQEACMNGEGVIQRTDGLVEAGGVGLEGSLAVPEGAAAIVVFAHGSGSSRHSRRNRFVADAFNTVGLATLLFDLLTPNEETIDLRTGALRFDIRLLADRLTGAVDWVGARPAIQALRIGLFGASTGAAAALIAAARRPDIVGAVVSRGGRPDLAGDALPAVQAPTLLIVGGRDTQVLELNQQASELMRVEHRLAIVPGASHLFEEPGKLAEVAAHAGDWFQQHLTRSHRAAQQD
jgi:putative phosphoribosyl transferase